MNSIFNSILSISNSLFFLVLTLMVLTIAVVAAEGLVQIIQHYISRSGPNYTALYTTVVTVILVARALLGQQLHKHDNDGNRGYPRGYAERHSGSKPRTDNIKRHRRDRNKAHALYPTAPAPLRSPAGPAARLSSGSPPPTTPQICSRPAAGI